MVDKNQRKELGVGVGVGGCGEVAWGSPPALSQHHSSSIILQAQDGFAWPSVDIYYCESKYFWVVYMFANFR